jgi:hypothetical protein
MRLGLFDRIRRLARGRRPVTEASGVQGRHRRGERQEPPGPPAFGDPSLRRGEWPTSPGRTATQASRPDDAARSGPGRSGPAGYPPAGAPFAPDAPAAPSRPIGSRRSGSAAERAGTARARIREAPADADAAAIGFGEVARPAPAAPGAAVHRPHWHQAARPAAAHAAGAAQGQAAELTRVAAGVPRQSDRGGRSSWRAAGAALRTRLPFTAPHARERPPTRDGRRNCGSIERILWRQWDTAAPPPDEVIEAVERLAELPERIKERLADGLDAIFIGSGGVPELDDMTGLRGVPLPGGRATWDACAGAYGERKIVVGSQPSPTPDVMCHEVGHALDDLDSPPGKWQSDSAEFRTLYDQCQPHIASDFHRQPGGLGRKEFFADAFAAIASRQRPALVDMLGGDTRTALRVMLYFNRRYGI